MTYKYFLAHDDQRTLLLTGHLPSMYRHDGREAYLLMRWGSWNPSPASIEEIERLFKPITEKEAKSIIIKWELKR